ncbi:MAG: inorganic diphosphatase [Nitrospinota bacterium]|nr:inorganic diphosphatase [Nitrospinota bacterium]
MKLQICGVSVAGVIIFLILFAVAGFAQQNIAPGLRYIDPYTLAGEKNLLTDYPPTSPDGRTQVVIEIPAGTNAKWAVMEPDGVLVWEKKKGKPRVVKYLAYPGNYGMVPGTLGGDGDPLDVLVLGHALARGSVVKVKVIGVLKLVDTDEQDDKLIAVLPSGPLGKVDNLAELEEKFAGVKSIVETWFVNYKGPGKMESQGYADTAEAQKVLTAAINAHVARAKME